MNAGAQRPASRLGMGTRVPAFTLVEMVVVIAIVLVILALVLPAASALWEERKLAVAENTVQGLLMTARVRALQAEGVQSGLFYFVDDRGAQQAVAIEQDRQNLGNIVWRDVFVLAGRARSLPVPMRVVPRYAVVEPAGGGGGDPQTFSADELDNNNFGSPEVSVATNQAQRHRNFFAMVFSGEGQLLAGRNVLIRDVDSREVNNDCIGDGTGLSVGCDAADPQPVVEFYQQDDSRTQLDPTGAGQSVGFLVSDGSNPPVAINFPSVDGLLVYDNVVFDEVSVAEDKRDFLLRTALPFYVNRMTGAIVRGPSGENLTP